MWVALIADVVGFWFDEIRLTIKNVVAEWLNAYAMDRSDVVLIGIGSRRLLDAP